MTRIEGPNNINNDIKIGLNKVENTQNSKINSTFGDGFSTDNAGIAVERTIPGLEMLLASAQFDFEPPIYPKGGFGQFNPTDADFAAMEHLDTVLDAPEKAYCEV